MVTPTPAEIAWQLLNVPNLEHAEALVQPLSDDEFSALILEVAEETAGETMAGLWLAKIIDDEIARRCENPLNP